MTVRVVAHDDVTGECYLAELDCAGGGSTLVPSGGGVPGDPSDFPTDWPCAEAEGTKVYNTADGLRGVPEHYSLTAGMGQCFNTAIVTPTAGVVGNVVLPGAPVMGTVVVNNPSLCRDMNVYCGFGHIGINVLVPFNGPGTQGLLPGISKNGGVFNAGPQTGTYGNTSPIGAPEARGQSSWAVSSDVLPPGGSITYDFTTMYNGASGLTTGLTLLDHCLATSVIGVTA